MVESVCQSFCVLRRSSAAALTGPRDALIHSMTAMRKSCDSERKTVLHRCRRRCLIMMERTCDTPAAVCACLLVFMLVCKAASCECDCPLVIFSCHYVWMCYRVLLCGCVCVRVRVCVCVHVSAGVFMHVSVCTILSASVMKSQLVLHVISSLRLFARHDGRCPFGWCYAAWHC